MVLAVPPLSGTYRHGDVAAVPLCFTGVGTAVLDHCGDVDGGHCYLYRFLCYTGGALLEICTEYDGARYED